MPGLQREAAGGSRPAVLNPVCVVQDAAVIGWEDKKDRTQCVCCDGPASVNDTLCAICLVGLKVEFHRGLRDMAAYLVKWDRFGAWERGRSA